MWILLPRCLLLQSRANPLSYRSRINISLKQIIFDFQLMWNIIRIIRVYTHSFVKRTVQTQRRDLKYNTNILYHFRTLHGEPREGRNPQIRYRTVVEVSLRWERCPLFSGDEQRTSNIDLSIHCLRLSRTRPRNQSLGQYQREYRPVVR